jgi:Fe2+ or Zn2+ uptake regulation protein
MKSKGNKPSEERRGRRPRGERKVDMFDDSALEQAIWAVAGSHGYALGEHDVVLRGACGDCRS